MYLFLAALRLHCCVRAFSNCIEWGLLLLWSTGSRLMGFSSCGMQAQQLWLTGSRAQAQQLWHMGLVALWHVGSSWTRVGTCVPCIGRQILNHGATREVPVFASWCCQVFSCKSEIHEAKRKPRDLTTDLFLRS